MEAIYRVERFGPVVRIRMAPTLLGRPLMWVNAFWVDGLLIDTGCPTALDSFLAALQREQLRVEQLVNTHSHEDHVGGNAAVCDRWGVTPRIHALGMAGLVTPDPTMLPYRRMFWGEPESCPGEALGGEVETDRYRFRVLATPGHAPDHVALFEEREGWLLCGDLFLSARLNRVRAPEEPLQTLESLRRLAALPVQKLFCSHAYKVADSVAPLQAKIGYWERLQRDAIALRRQGVGLRAATRRLLGAPGAQELFSQGDLSKEHLVRGLLRTHGGHTLVGGGDGRDAAQHD